MTQVSLGQQVPKEYGEFIKRAESQYRSGDYEGSSRSYSSAFKMNGWKGFTDDRYNAACSWALSKKPDSAFFNINRIKIVFFFYGKRILSDPDFNSLHHDKRWKILSENIKHAVDSVEANYNKPVVRILDTVFNEDQKYRLLLDEIDKNSLISKELKSKQKDSVWNIIREKDAINLVKVKLVLDTYGWLGPNEIGYDGNSTLFLVIQHSDQATQQKYLPIMREAVKHKKANPSDLALLEDRVALGQGKKQIYGSQVGGEYGAQSVLPLEDPDNVDKRRAQVGLQPLAEYLQFFNIKWNLEEYKKNQQGVKGDNKKEEVKPSNGSIYFLGVAIVLIFIVVFAALIRRKNRN